MSHLESGIAMGIDFPRRSVISQSPTPSRTSTSTDSSTPSTDNIPSTSTTPSAPISPTSSSTTSTSGAVTISTTSVRSIGCSTSSISTNDSAAERQCLHLIPASSLPLPETWNVVQDNQRIPLVLPVLAMIWAIIESCFSIVGEWWQRDQTKLASRVQELTLELARVKGEEEYWRGKARELEQSEQELFNLAQDLNFDVEVLTDDKADLEVKNDIVGSENAMLDDEVRAARNHIRRLDDRVSRLTNENRYLDQEAEVLRYQNELLSHSFEISVNSLSQTSKTLAPHLGFSGLLPRIAIDNIEIKALESSVKAYTTIIRELEATLASGISDKTLSNSQIMNLMSEIEVHQGRLARRRRKLKEGRKTRAMHVEAIGTVAGKIGEAQKETTESNDKHGKHDCCVDDQKRIHQAELNRQQKNLEVILTAFANEYVQPLRVNVSISTCLMSMFELSRTPQQCQEEVRSLKRQNEELLGTRAKARQNLELLEALTRRKVEALDESIHHSLPERGQVLEALRDRVAEIGAAYERWFERTPWKLVKTGKNMKVISVH